METSQTNGQITVAPDVLEAIVRLTTLAIPGVAHLASAPGVRRLLGHSGVAIAVVERRVQAEVYVVAERDVQVLDLGHKIQNEVSRAIHDMVGMEVESIDVHIEDVAYTSEKT